MCYEGRDVIQYGPAEDGRPYQFDAGTFDDLGRRRELPAPAEARGCPPLPPTDLKVHDPNVVAPLREPLQEVMALMWAPLNPVRFLEDEYSHDAYSRVEYAVGNAPRDF